MKQGPPRNGFTLIEMAVVIIVMGIIIIPLFKLYEQYIIRQRLEVTRDHIMRASSEIAFFFNSEYRYPCPANRALAANDPAFGTEFDANCNPAAAGLSIGNCTPDGGLCLVPGARLVNGVAAPVLIGALPVRSMKLRNGSQLADNTASDGWGAQMTYAVTLSQTDDATFNLFNGSIAAQDEFGQPTAGINNDAHYAVISHGSDQRGAFGPGGTLISPCATAGTARDHENCDNDSTFTQALGVYRGNSPDYFDDYAFFTKSRASILWDFIPTGAGVSTDIYNLNTDNVGVGTDSPSQRLDVAGDVRTDNVVRGTQLCQQDGTDCFDINAITSDSVIRCPTGQVMVAIDEANEICAAPVFAPVQPNVDCSPGWVAGIRTNGEVLCTTP